MLVYKGVGKENGFVSTEDERQDIPCRRFHNLCTFFFQILDLNWYCMSYTEDPTFVQLGLKTNHEFVGFSPQFPESSLVHCTFLQSEKKIQKIEVLVYVSILVIVEMTPTYSLLSSWEKRLFERRASGKWWHRGGHFYFVKAWVSRTRRLVVMSTKQWLGQICGLPSHAPGAGPVTHAVIQTHYDTQAIPVGPI